MIKRGSILRTTIARRRMEAFLRDRRGAMAVEFALVSLPLFFMLFAIMELAVVFMVASTLENATSDVARTIRTGAVQSGGGGTANDFRNAICGKIGWLQNQCQANLSIDVRTFNSFTNPNPPDPVSNGTFNAASLTYSPGQPGDIVLVRAFYRWHLLTPFLNAGLQRLNGGYTMLTAATTFRNEPYQ